MYLPLIRLYYCKMQMMNRQVRMRLRQNRFSAKTQATTRGDFQVFFLLPSTATLPTLSSSPHPRAVLTMSVQLSPLL